MEREGEIKENSSVEKKKMKKIEGEEELECNASGDIQEAEEYL